MATAPRQPYPKAALTFAQQVELLQRRGMSFADKQHAAEALSRISYYRLSAYWYEFKRSDDTFVPNTLFETALELYEFDRRLRLVVLDAIERVEVLVRTVVTYHFGHAHGPFGHWDPKSFRPDFDHAGWTNELLKEVARSRESFIKHFERKYDGYPKVPIWMASEIMSFGVCAVRPDRDPACISRRNGRARELEGTR